MGQSIGVATGPVAMLAFSFKYCLAPTLEGFDYPPHLMCEEVAFWPRAIERGQAVVALLPSETTPGVRWRSRACWALCT